MAQDFGDDRGLQSMSPENGMSPLDQQVEDVSEIPGKKTKKRGKRGCKRPREIISLPSGEEVLEIDTDFFCSSCQTSISRQGVDDHFQGRKHKNMEKLELLYHFLAEQGLSWTDDRKYFQCNRESCKTLMLPAKYEELEHHVFKKHFSSVRPSNPSVSHLAYVGSEMPKIIYGTQGGKKTKVFWKNFDIGSNMGSYDRILCPSTVISDGTKDLLLQVINGNFKDEDLQEMTTLASYLATHGEPVRNNGGIKGGTHMMCHGFRYSRGAIGRFRQRKNPLYYSYGEKLSLKLSNHLKVLFPKVFELFETIREKEKMPEDVGRIGGSPFTCMAVTKDYSCNPHVDEDDLSYGFFIWLGSNGSKDVKGNEAKFIFPSLGYYMEPEIGSILLCKSNELVHCTKTVGSPGQLGIALFLKSTFFQGYQVLRDRLEKKIEDRLTLSWKDSEVFYGDI